MRLMPLMDAILALAEAMAARFDNGTVIAQGTATEILDNPDVLRVYLGENFSL